MTILVTGATGLIGSHLCKTLVAYGNQVIGLVHNRVNPLITYLQGAKNFRTFFCDIRDNCSLLDVIRRNKVKTVFHTAAQLPYTPNKDLVGVNISGILNLLKACKDVDEFIYASSMGVYSDPPSYLPVDEIHPANPSTPYGMTKLAGELYCMVYGKSMRVTILRYAGVYGVGSEKNRAVNIFIRCALKNEPLVVDGDGSQGNDFTYIDDIIQGTYLAWKKQISGVYNIGSGQDITIMELAKLIIKITNSKSEIIQNGAKVNRPFRFYLDITKAKKELGYTPCLVEDGLTSYVKEFIE